MITRLMKKTAAVLCAVMMVECVSAGFVWADTGDAVAAGADNEAVAEETAAPDDAEGADEEIAGVGTETVADETAAASADAAAEEAVPEKEKGLDAEEEGMSLQDEQTDTEHLNGWVDTDAGRMYYVDGEVLIGLQEIDGQKYYFDESGIMRIGFQDIDGKRYYFGDDGTMQTGFQDIGGKRYCFGDDGVMLTGMVKFDGSWYYFGEKGVMKTGWKKIKKKKYYFDLETGERQHGKKKIGKNVYYFDKNGVMATGWLKVDGKKYYHKSNGSRVFGAKKLGKYYYYFKPKSGVMKTGWLKLKGKRYYYDSKGHKCFGVKKINGKTYYLHPKTGARMSKGSYYLYKPIWNKSSRTRYLIYVNKKSRYVTVYRGSKRNWTVVRRMRCSIGKPSTPTPSGTYRVTSKVSHFGESKGYSVWYATGFIGTMYLLHSVVCYRGTKRVSDGRLGKAISHGCIRMSLGSALWVYKTVPRGSTVYIK